MTNIIYEVKTLHLYLYVLTFNALGSRGQTSLTAGAIAIRTRQRALLALA